MRTHRPLVAIGLVVTLAIGAVSPAVAHESQTIEGYDLTFGGADEPVITNERMWLELDIVDNETGEPVTNQTDTLNISVQKPGQEKVELDVSEKHGEPGVYETAVIFTEPGEYVVHVEGSIEGTAVHTHFEKEVHDHTELRYPRNASQSVGNESGSAETESRGSGADTGSQTDENDARPSQSTFNPGFGAVITALGVLTVVGGLYMFRRR